MSRKTQTFFEYQNMLENEYGGFSPEKLLALGTRIAELEFGKYSSHFQVRRFDKYGLLLKDALLLLRSAVDERKTVTGPEIDQAQKNAIYASNKLWRKLNDEDGQDKGLISILTTISNTIHYLKTEDPLYMITVWQSPGYGSGDQETIVPEKQVYYALLREEFSDQIDLLWQLKCRLGI